MGLLLGSMIAGGGAGANRYLEQENERRRQEQAQKDRMETQDAAQEDRLETVEREAELRQGFSQSERDAKLDGLNRMKEAVGQLPEEEQAALRADPMKFGAWAIENGFSDEGKAFVTAAYYKSISDLKREQVDTEAAKQLKFQAEALRKQLDTWKPRTGTGTGAGTGSRRSGGLLSNAPDEDGIKHIRSREDLNPEQMAAAETIYRTGGDTSRINASRAIDAAQKGQTLGVGQPRYNEDAQQGKVPNAPGDTDTYARIAPDVELAVPGETDPAKIQTIRPGQPVVGSKMDQFINQRLASFRKTGQAPSEQEMGAMAAQRLAGKDPSTFQDSDSLEALKARFRTDPKHGAQAPAQAPAPKRTGGLVSRGQRKDPLDNISTQKARELREDLEEEKERYAGQPAAAGRIAEIDELISRIDRRDF